MKACEAWSFVQPHASIHSLQISEDFRMEITAVQLSTATQKINCESGEEDLAFFVVDVATQTEGTVESKKKIAGRLLPRLWRVSTILQESNSLAFQTRDFHSSLNSEEIFRFRLNESEIKILLGKEEQKYSEKDTGFEKIDTRTGIKAVF